MRDALVAIDAGCPRLDRFRHDVSRFRLLLADPSIRPRGNSGIRANRWTSSCPRHAGRARAGGPRISRACRWSRGSCAAPRLKPRSCVDLVDPRVRHMAVRASRPNPGPVGPVNRALQLLINVVAHLMAGDAERFGVGQLQRPVEAAPKYDSRDAACDDQGTPGHRGRPPEECPYSLQSGLRARTVGFSHVEPPKPKCSLDKKRRNRTQEVRLGVAMHFRNGTL